MSEIVAEIYRSLSITNASYEFWVIIKEPYQLPPFKLSLSYQQIMILGCTQHKILDILYEKVWNAYHEQIENLPFFEMLELPREVFHPVSIRLIPEP